jgi:hypothetical protein
VVTSRLAMEPKHCLHDGKQGCQTNEHGVVPAKICKPHSAQNPLTLTGPAWPKRNCHWFAIQDQPNHKLKQLVNKCAKYNKDCAKRRVRNYTLKQKTDEPWRQSLGKSEEQCITGQDPNPGCIPFGSFNNSATIAAISIAEQVIETLCRVRLHQ